MSVTFNLPALLTVLTMIGGMLLVATRIGKYTGEVTSMIRELKDSQQRHDEEIVSLRKSRHEHGEDIHVLKIKTDNLEADVGELIHVQRNQAGG